MKVTIFGNTRHTIKILQSLSSWKLEVISTVSTDDELEQYCRKHEIPISNYSKSLNFRDSELVLLFECHKIIPEIQFTQGLWLNLHSGLLPKWRGYSANSWALMNEEPLLGFTLHEVESEFDSGKIVFYWKRENILSKNYQQIFSELLEDITVSLMKVLNAYLEGSLVTPSPIYPNNEIFYCSKLTKRDGLIDDFNLSNQWIQNLGRLFIRIEDSDFRIKLRQKIFRVYNVEKTTGKYLGFPGKVLRIAGNQYLIKTADGALWFTIDEDYAFNREPK